MSTEKDKPYRWSTNDLLDKDYLLDEYLDMTSWIRIKPEFNQDTLAAIAELERERDSAS